MDFRFYNRELKRYDKDLFCSCTEQGKWAVFRRTKRYVPVLVTEDFKLLNLIEAKELVFALTDSWTMTGQPRAWGIDFILNRLREIDLQANERLIEEMDERNERVDKSKERDFTNHAEAFWSDNRRAFAKATDGILTHSLSKDEPKKRLRDRRIKNGNY